MKEYRATIKVRNNLILRALEDRGIRVGPVWCDSVGLLYYEVHSLINLKKSPVLQSGEYTKTALKLCEVLRVMPSDLWTQEQLYPIEKNSASVEMDADEVEQLILAAPSASEALENKQRQDIVAGVLGTLSERHKEILRMRFEQDMTYEECGDALGVTRERARQIEAKAIRLLRHPGRSSILREAM